MRIDLFAFTTRALALARRVRDALKRTGDVCAVFAPARMAPPDHALEEGGLTEAVGRSFASADALVFVCATGICVRACAPYVADKLRDPAVVCVDEQATLVLPVLSGHVGGANELGRRIADALGTRAHITTATDLEGVFALDTWAASCGLTILERDGAKRVSATLLSGGRVGFRSDFAHTGELPEGLSPDAGTLSLGVHVTFDEKTRPFADTVHLVPKTVVVGIGCRKGVGADAIGRLVDACLGAARISACAVRHVATIDLKATEPGLCELCAQRGWELVSYGSERLAQVPGDFTDSAFVEEVTGVGCVCERAACAEGATLVSAKAKGEGVTCAIATMPQDVSFGSHGRKSGPGRLTCVGLGPGGFETMTFQARRALEDADAIYGYATYVNLIADEFADKELRLFGMRQETARVRAALERARTGDEVCLVSSGDAGIYGMAAPALEMAEELGVKVDVVCGITAAVSGAALLGAPLGHDWCSVSLSDHLTPWTEIERRLSAAASTGFVICLYNVCSEARPDHLRRACEIVGAHLAPTTVCGIAHGIGRKDQWCRILSLAELTEARLDMASTVFVGNARTRVCGGRMVTPRGYGMGDR